MTKDEGALREPYKQVLLSCRWDNENSLTIFIYFKLQTLVHFTPKQFGVHIINQSSVFIYTSFCVYAQIYILRNTQISEF